MRQTDSLSTYVKTLGRPIMTYSKHLTHRAITSSRSQTTALGVRECFNVNIFIFMQYDYRVTSHSPSKSGHGRNDGNR